MSDNSYFRLRKINDWYSLWHVDADSGSGRVIETSKSLLGIIRAVAGNLQTKRPEYGLAIIDPEIVEDTLKDD